MQPVIVIGAGIGGLTLALSLNAANIPCLIFEAAPDIRPLGVGINLLPYAMDVLCGLGLEARLSRHAVVTAESVYCESSGVCIFREPAGRAAGHRSPQLSIHRGVLQTILLEEVRARLGIDAVRTGWKCVGASQDGLTATAEFVDTHSGAALPRHTGSVVIGCDGLHSVLRRQLYPQEGDPRYSGTYMWRGLSRWTPFLTGASMVRIGLPSTGKLVLYPISSLDQASNSQLMNWVVEINMALPPGGERPRPGTIGEFSALFEDWQFDWLDVPGFLAAGQNVLQCPMSDRDPLSRWSFGRLSLLGDAAHPMVPLGSNGAGQAILDAHALAHELTHNSDPVEALLAYESSRRPKATEIVMADRRGGADVVLESFLKDRSLSVELLARQAISYRAIGATEPPRRSV